VTEADVKEWEADLAALLARIDPIFAAAPARGHARSYMRGLLSPLARKNGWTIAEYVGESEPKGLQRFLNIGRWDTEKLLEFNRDYAMQHFGCPDAILVADPTGFAKKGKMSVGVQRQYSGTLGRVDNCQIATFLSYVTPGRDRVLIDRRLYMPNDSWIADPQRCTQAGCPPELTFKTRPQQVREMIEAAFEAEVPFAWFTADEEFGRNPGLCEYLEGKLVPYVMAVPKNTVFTARGIGNKIEEAVSKLAPNEWVRRAWGIGSKGFRVYDWALLETDEPDIQFMTRRGIETGEIAYYRCHNPNGAAMTELVGVAGARWPIEECFGSGKNEVGLDNYQVRTWIAWHRHITFAMLAHTFLAVTACREKTKKGNPDPNPKQTDKTAQPTPSIRPRSIDA